MIGWSDLPQCKPFEPLGLTCLDMFKQVNFRFLVLRHGCIDYGAAIVSSTTPYLHVFSFFEKLGSYFGNQGSLMLLVSNRLVS